MTKIRFAFSGALLLTAAALAGCGEDPITSLIGKCDAPEGTSPFAFRSSGTDVFGFIDLPKGPGPHPAILLVHGDGPTDVTKGGGAFEPLRNAFREAGIATVVWDKAGSGCSAGRYRGIADLYLRADTVLDAVAALRERDDIDPERVGAWAAGQGGWVAPMAAARGDDLAYLIVVGGPGHDPIRQGLYLVRTNLALEGYPAAESKTLVDRLDEAFTLMAEQAPYEEYVAVMGPLAEHPFLEKLRGLGSDLYPTVRRYGELQESAALEVDTEVFLPAIDVPVLAIWGDLDSQVDWREAATVYRESFAASGNPDLTVRIFEGADHGLCEARRGSLDEQVSRGECDLAAGYVDTMVEWLRAQGFTAPQPPQQSAASVATERLQARAVRR